MSHEYYVISTHLCIRHSRYNPHPHTACENQTRSACAWTNSKSLFRVMHKPNAMQTVDSAWVDHAGLGAEIKPPEPKSLYVPNPHCGRWSFLTLPVATPPLLEIGAMNRTKLTEWCQQREH